MAVARHLAFVALSAGNGVHLAPRYGEKARAFTGIRINRDRGHTTQL
jgi:hypothetical protein